MASSRVTIGKGAERREVTVFVDASDVITFVGDDGNTLGVLDAKTDEGKAAPGVDLDALAQEVATVLDRPWWQRW